MRLPGPRLLVAVSLAVAPLALLAALGDRIVMVDGWIHFFVVGIAAAIATGAAIALVLAGLVLDDGRSVLVGCAFSVMAALLCLHGLTTPGFLVEFSGVVGFTGGATLPVGCAILALTTVPRFRRKGASRAVLAGSASLLVAVVGLGASALAWPDLVPPVPQPGSLLALAVMIVGLALCGVLARRAWRTSLLTHRAADAIVAVGIVWLAGALVASLVWDNWRLGWWIGHGIEIVGMAMVGIPVALDLRRGSQSRPLVGDFRAAELVAREEEFLGTHVRALLVSLAAKDVSTEEHTRRVALLAVQVGERLGLPAARLRALALGGLLHDIGKLTVASEILQKPAALTDEEFDAVKRHPEAGVAILRAIGNVPEIALRIVHDHHERIDGRGYPHGVDGALLGLEARIMAACDVYDALVSDRVYRRAWTPEQALALLRQEVGIAFDASVVETLAAVVGAAPVALRLAG